MKENDDTQVQGHCTLQKKHLIIKRRVEKRDIVFRKGWNKLSNSALISNNLKCCQVHFHSQEIMLASYPFNSYRKLNRKRFVLITPL